MIINTGPKFTAKGELHNLIHGKVHVLKLVFQLGILDQTEKRMIQEKIRKLQAEFEQDKKRKLRNAIDSAWLEIIQFIEIEQQFKVLQKLYLYFKVERIINCTEEDMRNFLKSVGDKIQKSTFKKYCSEYRNAFRAIGRQHSVEGGIDIQFGNELVFKSYCPLSGSISNIDLEFKTKSNDSKKEGCPTSVCVWVLTLIEHLKKAVTKKYNDKTRTINLAQLTFLKCILMHEAGRPINETFHLQMHKNFVAILHKPVHFLTFVFLEDDTLKYLLENDKIKFYTLTNWKGKQQQENVCRAKSVIPGKYSVIDLFWTYIVCMKIIYKADIKKLSQNVFEHGGSNPSKYHGEQLRPLEITDLTFYSVRYAAAEEAVKMQIPQSWTRRRMGHSSTSEMYVEYSKNKGVRSAFKGKEILLGIDLLSDKSIMQHDYEFNVDPNITYDTDWINETFCGYSNLENDFIYTDEIVDAFLKNNDENTRELLENKFKGTDLRNVPIGCNIVFPNGIVPGELSIRHSKNIQSLDEFFANKITSSENFELKHFNQLIYSNWGNPFYENKVRNNHKKQKRESEYKQGEILIVRATGKKDKYTFDHKKDELVWMVQVIAFNGFSKNLQVRYYINLKPGSKLKNAKYKLDDDIYNLKNITRSAVLSRFPNAESISI